MPADAWVFKLGGSLNTHPRLRRWLALAAHEGAGRVVVVPGGGAFADEARRLQAHWRFDDLAAHNLAVLAMVQSGLMLCALEPALQRADDEDAAREALRAGRSAVWLPFDLLRDTPDELTSWEVTSDSLALRLAGRLGAAALAVVKSAPVPAQAAWADLQSTGLLDARFAAWAGGFGGAIHVVEASAVDDVGRALAGRAMGSGWRRAAPGGG